jgi:spermidine dehydrogenase
MMYTNVLLKRWTACSQARCFDGQRAGDVSLAYESRSGTTMGGYRGMTTPEEPILVHLVRNPNKPGLPRKEQNRAGSKSCCR